MQSTLNGCCLCIPFMTSSHTLYGNNCLAAALIDLTLGLSLLSSVLEFQGLPQWAHWYVTPAISCLAQHKLATLNLAMAVRLTA